MSIVLYGVANGLACVRGNSGLSPEIAMFDHDPKHRDPADKREWYIKGNMHGEELLDARYILR